MLMPGIALLVVGLVVGYVAARLRADKKPLFTAGQAVNSRGYLPQLHMSQEWLRITLQSIGDGVIATDAAGNVVFLNGEAERLTGWTTAEAMGRPLTEVFHIINEHTREPCTDPAQKVIATGMVHGLANHTVLVRRDGKEVVIADSAAPIQDDRGQIVGVVLVFRDETEKRRMEAKLRISEETYRNLFHNAQVGLFRSRISDGAILEANHQIAEMFGYASRSEFMAEFIAANHYVDPEQRQEMLRLLNKNGEVRHFEAHFRRKDGSKIWMLYSARAYPEQGWLEGVMEDITSRVEAEERLRYLSYHDILTGLYNRAYMEEEIDRLANEPKVAVVIGDVNGLKLVNDAFGHEQGDRLLVKVASILTGLVGEDGSVVRFGGDEFAIILPNKGGRDAQKLINEIRRRCRETGYHAIMTPSLALGMATRRGLDEPLRRVVRRAEDRMYSQKLTESASHRSAILAFLTTTLREKSFETEEHAQRTRKLAIDIGQTLGLGESDLAALALLATLHDIGKVTVDDYILRKPGPLTPQEWEEIRKHPEVGYRITLASPELAPISGAILAHHEWWDGSGYPRGLKGEEIPLIARIIALVDAYDVMIHGRPYRPAMTKEQVIEEIRRVAGKQFDPRLVEVFTQMLVAELGA
jgi:diguanylate cyclase (GGDEF)-like protein/PAS domain S-box-containing protein